MLTQDDAVNLRAAELSDADYLLQLRNHPETVMTTSSGAVVSPTEHMAWLTAALADSERRLFIVEADGVAVGQLRLELKGGNIVISVALAPEASNRGYGRRAINAGAEFGLTNWSAERVVACIREDNPRSRMAFEHAGFSLAVNEKFCPDGHWTLVRGRRP